MTLYVVQAAGSDPASLMKARFVRQGFSWTAFLFGWLWFAYHRVWIVVIVWPILSILYFIFVVPHLAPAAMLVIGLLVRLFVGYEANFLRLRRNPAVQDLVEARDRDEAESIFFRRQLDGAPA